MTKFVKPFAEAPASLMEPVQTRVWDFIGHDPLKGQTPLATPTEGESLMRDIRARMDLLKGRTIIDAVCQGDGVIEMKFDNGDVLLLPAGSKTPQLLWQHGAH